MSDLITLDKRKSIATLIGNDEVQELTLSLEAELAKPEYNFIVTPETVKDAKGVMADLNKIKSQIKDFSKFKVEQESDDINKFKGTFKDFEAMCQAKRDEIESKVKVFTDKSKEAHRTKLVTELNRLYDEADIRLEFREVNVEPLVNATGLTSIGDLVKSSRDKVEAMIDVSKGKQAQEDLRIKEAEIQRNKEIQYAIEADRLKRSEQDEANRVKERERLEREKQDALEQQRKDLEQKDVPSSSIAVPTETKQPVPTYTEPQKGTVEEQKEPVKVEGKKVVRVVATFDIPVPTNIPDDAVANKVKKSLLEFGIDASQLVSVEAL